MERLAKSKAKFLRSFVDNLRSDYLRLYFISYLIKFLANALDHF